jgi:hypothetical protein
MGRRPRQRKCRQAGSQSRAAAGQDALSPAKITAFSPSAPHSTHPGKDNLNRGLGEGVFDRSFGRGGGGGGGVSFGWEEDSRFLQSEMESRGGTMGPGTAAPSGPPQAPQLWGIAAWATLPVSPFGRCLQGSRRVQLDPGGFSPDDFSGILGFGLGRLQSLGEGQAANGLSLSLQRLAGGTRCSARGAARGQRGRRPLSSHRVLGCPAAQAARSVPGPRGYPGIMGVSVSLPHPLPRTPAPML